MAEQPKTEGGTCYGAKVKGNTKELASLTLEQSRLVLSKNRSVALVWESITTSDAGGEGR